MNIGFIYIALIVLGCLLACVLIWAVIELAVSLRLLRNKFLNDGVDVTYVSGDMNVRNEKNKEDE